MSLLARVKPRYRLHVRVRGPETDERVTLYPGYTLNLNDDDGRTTLRVKFHGEDGIEVIQLVPTLKIDPVALRRWTEFSEKEKE